jgi:hypothetical protein
VNQERNAKIVLLRRGVVAPVGTEVELGDEDDTDTVEDASRYATIPAWVPVGVTRRLVLVHDDPEDPVVVTLGELACDFGRADPELAAVARGMSWRDWDTCERVRAEGALLAVDAPLRGWLVPLTAVAVLLGRSIDPEVLAAVGAQPPVALGPQAAVNDDRAPSSP